MKSNRRSRVVAYLPLAVIAFIAALQLTAVHERPILQADRCGPFPGDVSKPLVQLLPAFSR